jgi:acetyl-CoA carboxylase alpha subunit
MSPDFEKQLRDMEARIAELEKLRQDPNITFSSELEELEARRDKTRALRQAIMQELLTGKTRLVPTGSAHA